jgi:hypothetical protein
MPEIYQIWHESNEYKTNNTLIATTDYTSNYLVCIKVKPKPPMWQQYDIEKI